MGTLGGATLAFVKKCKVSIFWATSTSPIQALQLRTGPERAAAAAGMGRRGRTRAALVLVLALAFQPAEALPRSLLFSLSDLKDAVRVLSKLAM